VARPRRGTLRERHDPQPIGKTLIVAEGVPLWCDGEMDQGRIARRDRVVEVVKGFIESAGGTAKDRLHHRLPLPRTTFAGRELIGDVTGGGC
jgi:hypothetical protein